MLSQVLYGVRDFDGKPVRLEIFTGDAVHWNSRQEKLILTRADARAGHTSGVSGADQTGSTSAGYLKLASEAASSSKTSKTV